MSLRSLFSSAVSATEATINGTVRLGTVVGDASSWLQRQSSRLNHEQVIKTEEREFLIGLQERNSNVIEKASKLNLADLVNDLEELDKLLGIK